MNLQLKKLNMYYLSKLFLGALLLALLPLMVSFSGSFSILQGSASAQEEEEGRRAPPAARSSQTLSRPVYERLEEIMELRDAEDFVGANAVMAELREIYDRGRMNDAETLRLWQFYANFAAIEENYEEAIRYQELILGMGDAITPENRESTLLLLGQLKFAVEDYDGAIESFLTYLDMALEPDINVYTRITMAHYTMEEYAEALPYILEYIDLMRAQGQGAEIPKNIYGLARSLYTLLEDLPSALQITREMIVLFREPDDWRFMANVLGALERFEEQSRVIYALNQFGYVNSEGQVMNLSAQFFNAEYYWGSAKVLEQAMEDGIIEPDVDSWTRIAQSYQLAREDELAIEPTLMAAELADDGEMYSRLSSIYINLGRFDDAVEALNAAFDKGDLNRPDQAYLRQARAYLELERHDEGIEAVRLAARDERSEEAAATWLRYIQNEKTLYETKQRQRELYQGFFR